MICETPSSETVIAPELWICAPSRALTVVPGDERIDHERIDAASGALRALGWSVKEAANVRQVDKSFAGTDAQRAAGFEEAMCAPQADLVLALRGGSGTARILDRINWDRVGASHAVFMGLSDLTAINLALYAKCGKASWQGPVAAAFSIPDETRVEFFMRAMSRPLFEEKLVAQGEAIEAEGVLWGGNLSVLTSLIGTPYFPQIDGGILYLEDINEPAWRVSRMLSQLKLSGVLQRQKLILAGDFTGTDRNAGSGAGRLANVSVSEKYVFPHVPESELFALLVRRFGNVRVLQQLRVKRRCFDGYGSHRQDPHDRFYARHVRRNAVFHRRS